MPRTLLHYNNNKKLKPNFSQNWENFQQNWGKLHKFGKISALHTINGTDS